MMFKRYPDIEITNLDKLTYAGNLDNLRDITNPGYTFIQGDICDPDVVNKAMEGVDTVVHFAAESHVDRSIKDGSVFVTTNVLGTNTLLNCALRSDVNRYIHVSTDEVYGSIDEGSFTEKDPRSRQVLILPARRPEYSVLVNTKTGPMRHWRDALRDYLKGFDKWA